MRKAKDVDEYIANAQECTRPILVKLRRIFQRASPKLLEAIKWGVPCFVYKGPVRDFAAYKKHVSWGLWKGGFERPGWDRWPRHRDGGEDHEGVGDSAGVENDRAD